MGWFGFGAGTSVSPAQAKEILRGNAVLIDVREANEWRSGHVAGAIHIPLGKLSTSTGRIPKQRQVLVICQSGMRSCLAAERLRGMGYDVLNVSGGMTAWVRQVGL